MYIRLADAAPANSIVQIAPDQSIIDIGGARHRSIFKHTLDVVADSSGNWFQDVPTPSYTNNPNVGWTVRYANGQFWAGMLVDGMIGPIAMAQLASSYAWIVGSGGSGGNSNLSGALASRPSANSVISGTYYTATDDNGGTTYRSDGVSTWAKVAASVYTVDITALCRAFMSQ